MEAQVLPLPLNAKKGIALVIQHSYLLALVLPQSLPQLDTSPGISSLLEKLQVNVNETGIVKVFSPRQKSLVLVSKAGRRSLHTQTGRTIQTDIRVIHALD